MTANVDICHTVSYTHLDVYKRQESVVDRQTEDNAADFTIKNSGDQNWKIQLKQNNIKLEKGQWYKLSLIHIY